MRSLLCICGEVRVQDLKNKRRPPKSFLKTGCALFFPDGQKGTGVRIGGQVEVNITLAKPGGGGGVGKAARTATAAVAAGLKDCTPPWSVFERSLPQGWGS